MSCVQLSTQYMPHLCIYVCAAELWHCFLISFPLPPLVSLCNLSPPKPQFASWLIEQVETGQYTGLRYVGQNKFRVPWKHNSRKDCKDEDSKIFRVGLLSSVELVSPVMASAGKVR